MPEKKVTKKTTNNKSKVNKDKFSQPIIGVPVDPKKIQWANRPKSK